MFMDEMKKSFSDRPTQLAHYLPLFFDQLRELNFHLPAPNSRRSHFAATDVDALGDFVAGLRVPLESAEMSGLLGNPWSVASLRSDEGRNAFALKWFLDPRGDHGCGDALLTYILAHIGLTLPGRFPAKPSGRCSVAVEECPDGDRASRVDIQIDDSAFFIVVEVKIGAPEQPRQLERYCDVAAARAAGARPWAVIFLTVDGRQPTTAAKYVANVVPLSWSEVGSALRRVSRAAPLIPRFLATTFAAHIASL